MSTNLSEKIRKDIITTILERLQGETIRLADKMESLKVEDHYYDVIDELNIPYVNHNGTPLAMDVFRPEVPEGTELPVVIALHGGGLVMGDRKMMRNYARLLAHKGYLVFTPEYRLVPRANVCDQLDDVCAGMDIIGTKLTEYDVDFGRIFMTGDSAGAYLAIYVAAMKNSQALQNAIGHEPSRMIIRGVGLISGMFYTQRRDPIGLILSDQFYGEKTVDENFVKYMDPENPEIVDNLPPAFMITSRGDFLNNYTLRYHKALEKAGKKCHIVYYPEKDLLHDFVSMNPTSKQSSEAIDKMLKWFETQVKEERNKADKGPSKKALNLAKRIEDGSIREQKFWQYIQELNSANDDRLDEVAMSDSINTYTYRRMFSTWKKYASTLTALGITGKNKSRLGIISYILPKATNILFAANMTGAMVSGIPTVLPIGTDRWNNLIKQEGITDLVIWDENVDPGTYLSLLSKKEELGLKNVILLHCDFKRDIKNRKIHMISELNKRALSSLKASQYWDDLVEKYEGYEICYGKYNKDELAMVVHTSGTTKGTQKPMAYTDFACNSALHRVFVAQDQLGIPAEKNATTALDYSAAFPFFNQLCSTLSLGGRVSCMGIEQFAYNFVESLEKNKTSVVFLTAKFFLTQMAMLGNNKPDLSSLKLLVHGGAYLSPDTIRTINEQLRESGSTARVMNGYGLSECGGACIVAPASCEDDTIGYPLPGVNVRIYDEDDKKYYKLEDGERTGLLLINSDGMCSGRIGDNVFFEPEIIEGIPYINTYDMVKVNTDGSLTYIGRGNRYFANNEGVRFNAGLVETSIAKHKMVNGCAVVPIYDKRLHDTTPALYITVTGENKVETVKNVILDAFTTGNVLEQTNLPLHCVISDELPINSTGKIDIYAITKGEADGDIFAINPVYDNGKLVDIDMVPRLTLEVDMFDFDFSGTPDELRVKMKPIGTYAAFMLAMRGMELLNSNKENRR